jgi:hypothetical protein
MFTLVSTTAFASEGWECAPEQLLMGRFAIRVQPGRTGLQATTEYLKNIVPGAQPVVRTIDVKATDISTRQRRGTEYSGQGFQLNVFPGVKPQRNPFIGNNAAVSALAVNVVFAPDAKLLNRPYVCIPGGL